MGIDTKTLAQGALAGASVAGIALGITLGSTGPEPAQAAGEGDHYVLLVALTSNTSSKKVTQVGPPTYHHHACVKQGERFVEEAKPLPARAWCLHAPTRSR